MYRACIYSFQIVLNYYKDTKDQPTTTSTQAVWGLLFYGSASTSIGRRIYIGTTLIAGIGGVLLMYIKGKVEAWRSKQPTSRK